MDSFDRLAMSRLAHALALALALGIDSGAIHAGTVTTCIDDNSPTSLRSIVSGASNNEIIDVSACNVIALTQGEVRVPVSITLSNTKSYPTNIAGNGSGRVLHSITGAAGYRSLTLEHVNIGGGAINLYNAAPALGGCILSGPLTLRHSSVNGCEVSSSGGALGGAIHADSVIMEYSSAQGTARAQSTPDAARGAIFSSGNVQCSYGMIRNSYTTSYGRCVNARGGGIYTVSGGVTLQGCSMDSNQARTGGAIYQAGTVGGVTLINSTISGNHAEGYGGVFSDGVATLKSSTIAFNYADNTCGGLYSKSAIVAQSTIVSNNSSGDPNCIDIHNPPGKPLTGANNLFSVAPYARSYPQDTIIADPKLSRLGLRGGWSLVHGLSVGSPAIDMGNNSAALGTDQRGTGYARQYGPAPDIGAYERGLDDDEIFYGSFR